MELSPKSELIVLVHGFLGKRAVLWPLAARLHRGGFRVQQWNYPSLFKPIEHHAMRLHRFLQGPLGCESLFHIVAHSMGSIIVRRALNHGPVKNLGRVVLLAPPNRGSPIARLASQFVGSVIRPTSELSDRPNSFVNELAEVSDVEIGVIAAKYDLLVPTANTHLRKQQGHEVLTATHNSLLFSGQVAHKTISFLRTGSF